MSTISILMATYNGEAYLNEQLDSILNQTERSWHLFVRDDGSQDATVEIIREYCRRDSRIRLVEDSVQHIGPKESFHVLLNYVEADYYFFCDQDDVWLKNKLQVLVQAMKNIDGPGAVYSDLEIVDASLAQIRPSMRENSSFPEHISMNQLLVQNVVTGCSMGMNRKLRDIVVHDNLKDAVMHDWWYSLRAKAIGKLVFVDVPLVRYRQHSTNVVGADASLFRGGNLIQSAKMKLSRTVVQAKSFQSQSTSCLSDSTSDAINVLITAASKHSLMAMYEVIQCGLIKTPIFKNVLYLLSLFMVNV